MLTETGLIPVTANLLWINTGVARNKTAIFHSKIVIKTERRGPHIKTGLSFFSEKIFHQHSALIGKYAFGYPCTRMQHRRSKQ